MTSIAELVSELLAAAPELGQVLAEHRADSGGQLLPHLFLADVTRWLVAAGPAAPVLAVLERHLADGDEDVQDVIALSFLENLEPGNASYAAVRAALGPGLQAELDAMERWEPGDP